MKKSSLVGRPGLFTSLALATGLVVALGACQTARRKPSFFGMGDDKFALDQSRDQYIRDELRIQAILIQLNERYGKNWENVDEVWAALQSGASQGNPDYREAEKLLPELEQLELARKNQLLTIKEKLVAEPALLTEHFMKDGVLARSAVPGDHREPELFPVEIQRVVRLSDVNEFALKDGKATKVVKIDNGNFNLGLVLENRMPVPKDFHSEHADDYALFVKMDCDKPVTVVRRFERDLKNKTRAGFELYNRKLNAAESRIVFPHDDVKCDLQLAFNKNGPYEMGIHIESDHSLDVDKIAGRVRETCLYDDAPATTPVNLFLNAHYRHMTCAQPAEDAALEPDPFEAMSNKLKALTGSDLPRDVIERRDFSYQLDFSRAPKLDAIILSTLEYKADFYGTMMARALKWHADRGVPVRIVTSGIKGMLFPAEKKLLEGLERQSPNIQVHYYAYDKFSIHHLHRVIHSKVLVTLSSTDPTANIVITGGRNIKDTFVYRQTPDYSFDKKNLTQYGKGDGKEPFIFFQDLELRVNSRPLALQVASQIVGIINRDHDNLHYRPTTLHLPIPGIDPALQASLADSMSKSTYLRHEISIPYVDDREMEKVFVDLFSMAKKSLRVVSPYFRPTEKISKAIQEALDRGVKIDFVTRLKLAGDNSPPITADVNKSSVNRYYKKMNVYAWEEDDSILHVKAVLVDNQLLYIGATNLNNRSFGHDIESGFLVTGPKVTAQFADLHENLYIKKSAHITEEQKISLISKILIPMAGGFF